MKRIGSWIGLCLVMTLVGCSRSQPGGGPEKNSKFTISGPVLATSINQGEAQTLALKVNRGSDFKETVKLEATAPKGIDVSISDKAIDVNDKNDVNMKVVVAGSVPPGEHIIQVKGIPDHGTPTTLDLRVKVTERSDHMKLAWRAPAGTPVIVQGESQTVKIALEPNAKYQPAVKLRAEAPSGLKVEMPSDANLKATEGSTANLKITADKEASVGEHTIRIMGAGDAANLAPLELKVRVTNRPGPRDKE